jgi:nucleoside-diphosphate-sugar epimerase
VILVTGGTGFVGQELARQLTTNGRPVRVLSRRPNRVSLPGAVEWAPGDLTEPTSLPSALTGVHTIIHLAAVVPAGRPPRSDLESVNVGGTEALTHAARAARVTRFIHVSSAGVYGDGVQDAPHREDDPLTPTGRYERSKLASERVVVETLEASTVRWVILRPPGLYGPDRPATAEFFKEVAHRRVWLHGPVPAFVHPTHVVDLVGALVRVLDRGDLNDEVLNIGGERPVDFREFIALVGKRLDRNPLQVSAPGWSRHAAAVTANAWGLIGTPPAVLQRLARPRVNRTVDIQKARRLLGFEPVTLDWGLDQTVTVLRSKGLLPSRRASPTAEVPAQHA